MSNQSETFVDQDYALMNIRKLAALDIVFHGPNLILAEFAFGVLFPLGLGGFVAYTGLMSAGATSWQFLLGCYLLFIALNYVPLLLYAIKIARQKSAQEEVAFELEHKERYARKYSVQSLLLLFPLIVPILALYQAQQKQTQA